MEGFFSFARFFAENSRKAAVTASASLPLKDVYKRQAVPLGLPDDGLDLLSLLPGEPAPAPASFPRAGGDPPHRPLQLRLLFQSGIGVVCLIDTLFRPGEFALDQIAQQRLRGLPVLLIQDVYKRQFPCRAR